MPRATSREGIPVRSTSASWTASRCNRTLRQLTSFVNRVERWHRAFLAAQSDCDDDEDSEPVRTDAEPGWLAQDASSSAKGQGRRHRKTYAARRKAVPMPSSRSHRPRSAPHNNSILCTPDVVKFVIRDDRLDQGALSAKPHPSYDTADESAALLQRGTCRWTGPTARFARDYDSILADGQSIILAFLAATSDPETTTHRHDAVPENGKPRRGPKSLSDMCLSKISQCMVAEQKDCDAVKNGHDGQHDLIGSQLQELEDYFGDSDSGWPPLRNVARACGISLLAQSISNGTIPEMVATQLVLPCCGRPLLTDFTDAVMASLVGVRTKSPATENAGWSPLGSRHLKASPLHSIQPQHLWNIQLCVKWALEALNTHDDPVMLISRNLRWRYLSTCLCLSELVEHPVGVLARELLDTVFCAALSHRRLDYQGYLRDADGDTWTADRSRSTSDLDKGLWTRLRMVLLSILQTAHASSTGTGAFILERLSRKMQILVEMGRDLQMSELQRLLVAQVFFAQISLQVLDDHDVQPDFLKSVESLLGTLGCRQDVVVILVGTFLSLKLRLDHMQRLAQQLSSNTFRKYRLLHSILAQAVSNAAMDYAADHHELPSVLAWATALSTTTQELGRADSRQCDTPSSKFSNTGYRWDETLEEWITKTPAMLGKSASAAVRQSSMCDESLSIERNPSSSKGLPPWNAQKRKRRNGDFEIFTDGDFEYRKRSRTILPDSQPLGAVETSCGMKARVLGRENRYLEDASEDELSLLE